jgi:hypothetical protein
VLILGIVGPTIGIRAQSNYATPYTFSTLAGMAGQFGSGNGTGSSAQFHQPFQVAVDGRGNVYVADYGNNEIRVVAPGGLVTTLAGNPNSAGSIDGKGSAASFSGPTGIAVDGSGNIFVADSTGNTIRKITSDGTVTTLAGSGHPGSADGTGSAAEFDDPQSLGIDGSGNLYVADVTNNTVRLVTQAGVVTTIAGTVGVSGSADGIGSAAMFAYPTGIAVDGHGNIFVGDTLNYDIREITPAVSGGSTTWTVSTIAGTPGRMGSSDGVGAAALFHSVDGIAVDAAGDVYVTGQNDETVRKLAPTTAGGSTTWTVTTLAGLAGTIGSTNGSGNGALFHSPIGIAVDGAGNVYVADEFNETIRWGALAAPVFAGSATANGSYDQGFTYSAALSDSLDYSASGLPAGLTIDHSTGIISGTVLGATGTYPVTLSAQNGAGTGTGTLTLTIAGGGELPGAPTVVTAAAGDGETTVSFTAPVLNGGSAITGYLVTAAPGTGPAVTTMGSSSPVTLSGLTDGVVYVVSVAAVNATGTGPAGQAVETVAPAAATTYSVAILASHLPGGGPNGVAAAGSGGVYVTTGDAVQKITSAGAASLVAGNLYTSGSADGTGAAASFNVPTGLAVDRSGDIIVADSGNNSIRKVTPLGLVTTMAGLVQGNADGVGDAAEFNNPTAVAVNAAGDIFVVDTGNNELREIAPDGTTTTLLAPPFNFANGPNGPSIYKITGVTVDWAGNPCAGFAVTIPQQIINNIQFYSYFSYVLKVTGSNSFVQLFDVQDPQDSNAGLGFKNGSLAADTLGNIYVLCGNAPYEDLTPLAGPELAQAPQQSAAPVAISADASGNLYEANPSTQSVIVLAPVGIIPSVLTQPTGATLAFGAEATLSVAASGTPAPSYQWQAAGVNIPGATSSTYSTSIPGTYDVVITNSAGSVTSSSAVLTAATRLANISSRAFVGTGADIEIAGFVISGPPGSLEQVLIRGAGPSLAQYNVSGVLAQPVLTLFNSSGAQIASNAGWNTASNSTAIAAAFSATGAFAFPLDSADSAILTSLPPGTYTAEIAGTGTTTGVALAEVYEIQSGGPELINISTRAYVGPGSDVEIGGFVVSGTQSAKVLIRAVGPTLGQFGVSGVLAQPSLNVVNSSGTTVATDTGWSTNANAAAIASEMQAVGAFPLPSGSADCALLLTLPPGGYTAVVSGVGSSSGVALVEVYQAP